jgi:hypothetical protein
MVLAAMASVGETMAPNTKQTDQGRLGRARCSASPTPRVVAATSPIASDEMTPALAFNSVHEVLHPAPKMSGGRNSSSTRSGGSSTGGIAGTNATASPPSTSSEG